LKEQFKKIVESKWFQNFIILVILSAGVVVGLETYPAIMQDYSGLLHILDRLILYIFVAEIILKMGAKGSKPWEYFYDGWNVFDFLIVAVCFLPIGGAYIAVLRLARILRADTCWSTSQKYSLNGICWTAFVFAFLYLCSPRHIYVRAK
jgi:voltage-gated sodium channel